MQLSPVLGVGSLLRSGSPGILVEPWASNQVKWGVFEAPAPRRREAGGSQGDQDDSLAPVFQSRATTMHTGSLGWRDYGGR